MDKCCVIHQTPRPQRRINGLQLPLNCQQVAGWIVITVTAILNFTILVQIQFEELKMASEIAYIVLYMVHALAHGTASLIDPSESELRKLPVTDVPEFDRSVHSHVIENGRCHLCNIYTSSKHTKHCSLCNKCVDHFDHHCKWLNTCIGRRNYVAFIGSLVTALLIAGLTVSLCVLDIALFFVDRYYLSIAAQNFVNCTVLTDIAYCRTSISFLVFMIIFGALAVTIASPLLHLCCFHGYINYLGISTFEYMMSVPPHDLSECCYVRVLCCCTNKYRISNREDAATNKLNDTESSVPRVNDSETSANRVNVTDGTGGVANLINILINNELGRARKMFIYDENKIHPHSGE